MSTALPAPSTHRCRATRCERSAADRRAPLDDARLDLDLPLRLGFGHAVARSLVCPPRCYRCYHRVRLLLHRARKRAFTDHTSACAVTSQNRHSSRPLTLTQSALSRGPHSLTHSLHTHTRAAPSLFIATHTLIVLESRRGASPAATRPRAPRRPSSAPSKPAQLAEMPPKKRSAASAKKPAAKKPVRLVLLLEASLAKLLRRCPDPCSPLDRQLKPVHSLRPRASARPQPAVLQSEPATGAWHTSLRP